jgi:hypothetical protein
MPTPTLTDVDLTDPTPPVPGDSERAAVHARARQLVRRRRMLQGAGALAAMLVLVFGVVAIAGGGSGGSGDAPVALVRVRPVSLVQEATVTLQLRNDDDIFEGVADQNGTVHFDEIAQPGTYRVFVTIESAEGDSGDPNADISTAIVTYEPFSTTLRAGTNTIDLETLTPVSPPTQPEAPITATR